MSRKKARHQGPGKNQSVLNAIALATAAATLAGKLLDLWSHFFK